MCRPTVMCDVLVVVCQPFIERIYDTMMCCIVFIVVLCICFGVFFFFGVLTAYKSGKPGNVREFCNSGKLRETQGI